MYLVSHTNDHSAKSISVMARRNIQAKLIINEPGDQYEREADAMANQVVNNGNTDYRGHTTGLIGKSLQRKCAACEEEDKKKKVMRKAAPGNAGTQASSSFLSSLASSKGGGSPLPAGTRSFMENAFSYDFSDVRVHTDDKASQMSKRIDAKAFTYGNDIYFNATEYSTDTDQGNRLLAHELTHVVQQQKTDSSTIHRQTDDKTSKKQAKRDDYLRRLSIWPDLAHDAWRSLTVAEQDIVSNYMTARYGSDFTSEFLRYTKLKKKPESVAHYTNVLTETHQQLYAKGYRLARIWFGIEDWVHPSGKSLHRILPSNPPAAQSAQAAKPKAEEEKTYEYGGVTYDKKTGKVKSYPKKMEARCMLPCLNSTDNADDCEDCCLDTIPANDDGCINFCITMCQQYYE